MRRMPQDRFKLDGLDGFHTLRASGKCVSHEQELGTALPADDAEMPRLPTGGMLGIIWI